MKVCTQCNHKFTLIDKIKSIKYACNTVKCSKCGSVFKRTSIKYSIITTITAVVISAVLFQSVFKPMFWKESIPYALSVTAFVVINDLLYLLTFRLGDRIKVDDSKYK